VRTMFSNSLCCWPQPYYSEMKIHTLPNFQLLQSNPNIVSTSLQVTHNDQAIHQQKEQLNCIDPSTLHCTWVQPTSHHLDIWNCTIFGTTPLFVLAMCRCFHLLTTCTAIRTASPSDSSRNSSLLQSVVDGGCLTTKPFIVRYLNEDEHLDWNNVDEFGITSHTSSF
jgi:hypothetical protein